MAMQKAKNPRFPQPTQAEINIFCEFSRDGNTGHMDAYLKTYGENIIEGRGNHAGTPLTWAAYSGQVDAIRLLLENGADIEGRGNFNRTALGWAAAEGHHEAVFFLLENGADINAADNQGWTAQVIARHYGHSEALEILEGWPENSRRQETIDSLADKRLEKLKQLKPVKNVFKKPPPPKF